MEEQILEIIESNYYLDDDRMECKAAAKEITFHVMEFMDWMLYKFHNEIQITDYFDSNFGEYRKEIKKYEQFYFKTITLEELYQYWLNNVKNAE